MRLTASPDALPTDPTSGCAGKIAYPSAQAAHRVLQAQQQQRHKPRKAKVYRCPYCHQYHQTHA
jgi:hypothetical protein